jgi:hypothetical protein
MCATQYPYLSFVGIDSRSDKVTWYVFRLHRSPGATPELAVLDGTEGAKDVELRELLGARANQVVAYDQKIGHWYLTPGTPKPASA